MARIIVDLDSTLCDISHRMPYYGKDWDKYNELMVEDSIIESSMNIVNALNSYGFGIIILTGRYEKYSNLVNSWLKNNVSFFYSLVCKPNNDNRSSIYWKCEWLGAHIKPGDFVFDDRVEIEEYCRHNKIGYIKPEKAV